VYSAEVLDKNKLVDKAIEQQWFLVGVASGFRKA